MKYCTHCGAQIHEEAVICVKCGCSVESPKSSISETESALQIVVKVFLILGCVSLGWLLIPLAWCIPMTVKVFKCFKNREPVSTGMKVCVLIFVNLIAGVCLLCMDEK